MSDQVTTARRWLSGHEDAWNAQDGRICGGGVEQPNGVTCGEPGEWGLRGYVHAYCPVHARQRIRERREIGKRATTTSNDRKDTATE